MSPRGYRGSTFFSYLAAKIFVLFGLRLGGMRRSGQNIEAEGLIGKILRNKELAADFRECMAGASSRTGSARTLPILGFAFSSVKVARHSRGCEWLWKTVRH